jgi:hypothetical protein
MHNDLLEVLLVAAVWCGGSAILGGVIGSAKDSSGPGALLGLIFGPLGLIAAYSLDNRPQCPMCGGRLNGQPQLCMQCRSPLRGGPRPAE